MRLRSARAEAVLGLPLLGRGVKRRHAPRPVGWRQLQTALWRRRGTWALRRRRRQGRPLARTSSETAVRTRPRARACRPCSGISGDRSHARSSRTRAPRPSGAARLLPEPRASMPRRRRSDGTKNASAWTAGAHELASASSYCVNALRSMERGPAAGQLLPLVHRHCGTPRL